MNTVTIDVLQVLIDRAVAVVVDTVALLHIQRIAGAVAVDVGLVLIDRTVAVAIRLE